MTLQTVQITKPDDLTVNFILGQSHFIKTVQDIHETLVSAIPEIKFGLAFCEASGDRLIRTSGTNKEMIKLATKNAEQIASGHSFIIFLKNTFPINVLNQIKNIQEVCHIFCATANPAQVIISETEQGRGIIGVIDGKSPLGIETKKDQQNRIKFLKDIGYKL